MRKIIPIVLLSIFFSLNADAQVRENPWTFGAGFTGVSYKTAQDQKYFNFVDMTGAPNIFFGRYLNRSFNLRLEYTYARVYYPSDNGYPNVINDQYRPETLHDLDLIIDFKLDNGYMFKDGGWFSPFLFAGVGGNHINDDVNFVVPVGLGWSVHFTPYLDWNVRASYRFGVDNTYNYTHYSTGINVNFGKPVKEPFKDSDNDGIEDKLDQCPNENGLADFNGCPDDDGDGIPNHLDACAMEAGAEDNQGCPWPDSDKDGVPDVEDECPFAAGVKATKGCPDADADGIKDGEDNCPKEFGPASNKGCPLPDSDGDGIPDEKDACPNEAGVAANNGCPEIGDNTGVVDMSFDAIYFDKSSSELTEKSKSDLDNVADMLRKNPDYRLRVEGHTDSVGDYSVNSNLSQKRARQVRDYLVREGGIDPTRFQVIGYGSALPISDNSTEEGRDKNRRVEIKLYKK